MPHRRLSALVAVTTAAGCYAPPDAPLSERVGTLESTALVFQAVDAGTGSALSDADMTVRYLVRSPIVFDASSVNRAPTIQPYEITHQVGHANLVLEVRLEADSYHRLDTVLTVPRGTTAGPITMRLSRRLEATAPAPAPTPVVSATPPPAAAVDHRAIQAGDRAFGRQEWLEATEAYQSMTGPTDEMSVYGRAYRDAKLNQGIAHMNRSEFGRALEILEEVVGMDEPSADAYLRLTQAQCAVGRTEEGLGTLAQVGRARNRMEPAEQSRVGAMIEYQRGVCSNHEFSRAETARDRVSSGARATRELNAFIEGARAMSPVPPEVFQAVVDAERRVEAIKRAMGRPPRG
jgi:hypothetical protein